MASVYRADTDEFLGFLTELYGPFDQTTKDWPFRAWRWPDGSLRNEPAAPVAVGGRLTAPPHITIRLAVRNIHEPDVHVLVPPEFLDFVLNHTGFRAAPAKPCNP